MMNNDLDNEINCNNMKSSCRQNILKISPFSTHCIGESSPSGTHHIGESIVSLACVQGMSHSQLRVYCTNMAYNQTNTLGFMATPDSSSDSLRLYWSISATLIIIDSIGRSSMRLVGSRYASQIKYSQLHNLPLAFHLGIFHIIVFILGDVVMG